MSTTVLLAEPEPATRGRLEEHLRHSGFHVVARAERPPDVVIASDDADFERWCGEAPVIVLGRPEADTVDRVRAFRCGCDDYVSRPFHYEELVERIRAVLRRTGRSGGAPIVAGPIEIDPRTRVVTVAGTRLTLSAKEYDLLTRLAVDPQRVFTKAELLRDIWGYERPGRTRTLDSHASRLRRKLRALDDQTEFIENDWGVGYRLLGLLPAA